MKVYFFALITVCALFISALVASAAERVALVVGNSAYQYSTPLANPVNDAEDMSARFSELGFEVIKAINVDLQGMRNATRKFVRKLDGAKIAVFFYAGHGLQVAGKNYLVPVDAQLSSHDDLDFETLTIEFVMSKMERLVKTNMVFLDACRDNPLARNLVTSMGTRSANVGRGLAKIGAGVGTLVAYATQPGNVALDGDISQRNSPYTTALLKHIGTPGEGILKNLVRVRKDVLVNTNGEQVPWEHSSLTGSVVLKEVPEPIVEPVPEPEVSAIIIAQPERKTSATNIALELALWDAIKDSNRVEYIKSYLDQFPQGTFAGLARLRMRDLETVLENVPEQPASSVTVQKPKTLILTAKEVETNVASLPKTVPVESLQTKPMEVAAPEVLTRELIRQLQSELIRVGCLSGKADGIWGKKSKAALAGFTKHSEKRLVSLDPGSAWLDLVRGQSSRVCPLICRKDYRVSSGKCVKKKQTVTVKQKPQKMKIPATVVETQNSPNDAGTKKKCGYCKHVKLHPTDGHGHLSCDAGNGNIITFGYTDSKTGHICNF